MYKCIPYFVCDDKWVFSFPACLSDDLMHKFQEYLSRYGSGHMLGKSAAVNVSGVRKILHFLEPRLTVVSLRGAADRLGNYMQHSKLAPSTKGKHAAGLRLFLDFVEFKHLGLTKTELYDLRMEIKGWKKAFKRETKAHRAILRSRAEGKI